MNEVKLRGKYLGASEIKEVGTNATKIRQFWIDVSENPEYPNTPELQLINDKCLLVDNLAAGNEIEVFARLKGKKTKMQDGSERVFVNIDAWKISKIERTSAAFVPPAAPSVPQTGTFAEPAPEGPKDKLPF